MLLRNLRGRLLLSLGLSAAVFVALTVYGDVTQVAAALVSFRWDLVPAILGLTLLNYLLRFLKWQFYLSRIGVQGLRRRDSALIFCTGMAMAMTPGKVGEWLKSYLLRELAGTPMSRSAPIVLAERLTDGLALVLLASGGLVLLPVAGQAIAALGAAAVVGLGVVWYRPLADAIFTAAEGIGPLRSPVQHLRIFYDATRTLFSPASLTLALVLGVVSWGAECLAFWLVLQGLGLEGGPLLVVQAAFILAASTLGGALLLTPGGLGVAEGSIAGLSQLLLALPRDLAAAAALLIRLSTLWFGVSLGLVALLLVSRRLAALPERAAQEVNLTPGPSPSPLRSSNEGTGE
ncbi:MAG: flippase-like domain-containing protein [Chloroflexi bacterium]|nr:flippase-like domain-containing protein [Chloroflexota bacterium]